MLVEEWRMWSAHSFQVLLQLVPALCDNVSSEIYSYSRSIVEVIVVVVQFVPSVLFLTFWTAWEVLWLKQVSSYRHHEGE